jgi:hypothetical protein
MEQPRVFILRTPRDAAMMVSFVKAHAGEAARKGRPLRVTVAAHRRQRSVDANAFMWAAVLQPIAEQACIAGRYFAAEVWHQHYSREFLPEVTSSGKEKWVYLPSGERSLAIGTSDLDSAEFNEYLTKVQADAATDKGVVFDRDASHKENQQR